VKIILLVSVIAVFAVAGEPHAEGAAAPRFTLADGNGIRLEFTSLRGTAVVGFYNDKDASERNDELSRELDAMIGEILHEKNTAVFRFAATDASAANFLTRPVWRRVLLSKSKELGMTLWGDWDGSMKKSYRLPDNESTFIVIDRCGVLRCLRSGRIPRSEFGAIKKILAAVLAE